MQSGFGLRPLVWLGRTKRDLMSLPDRVIDAIGYALYLAQIGARHEHTKIMSGFGDAGVLEFVESERGNTYRAAYTVRFVDRVYVLHVFQKRSKSGIATPKPDIDLIRKRLQQAGRMHRNEGSED